MLYTEDRPASAPASSTYLAGYERAGAQDCSDPVATISFGALAAALGAPAPADQHLDRHAFPLRRLRAGEALFRAGDAFSAIYVVRSGFLKTVAVDAAGVELVLGFPMGGDVVGLDGVETDRHATDVVALDMCSVAVVPFAQLTRLAREHAGVERLLYSVFSREVSGKHTLAWLLGVFSADARLAAFLLDVAERMGRLGYSRTSFLLRMTRHDIGSYLGMKLETVSRMFSAFAAADLIEVDGKSVTIADVEGLREIVGQRAHGRARPRRREPAGGRAEERLAARARLALLAT